MTGDPLPLPLSIPHTLKVGGRLYVVDEVAVDDDDDTLRLIMRRRYTLDALDPVDAVAIGMLDPERTRPSDELDDADTRHDCQFDGPVELPQTRPAPTAQPPVAGDELDDAVRIVEDAIDATSEEMGTYGDVMAPTERTGLAVVEALLEAGWQPPDELTGWALLLEDRPTVLLREHPGDVRAQGVTVRPLTYRRVW